MTSPALDGPRPRKSHHPGLCSVLLLVAAAPPLVAATSSAASGSASSSAAASSPATLPLNLEMLAHCKRDRPPSDRRPYYLQCTDKVAHPGYTPAVTSKWTPQENCQLSLAYSKKDWDAVQQVVKGFLSDLTCQAGPAATIGDEMLDQPGRERRGKAYYSAVFLNEASAAPALTRVLIHDPPPEIYGNRVGDFELRDLQLVADLGISVITIYQASTQPNAAISQVPGVLAQVAGARAGVAAPPLAPAPAAATVQPAPKGNLFSLATEATLATETSPLARLEQGLHARAEGELDPERKGELEKLAHQVSELQGELQHDKSTMVQVQTQLKGIEEYLAKMLPVEEVYPFAIRLVRAPRAFRRGGLNTASVVPQVSVTDQLAFSGFLQDYLLASLRGRAVADDSAAHFPPVQGGTKGPLGVVADQLESRYKLCQKLPSLDQVILTTAATISGSSTTITAQAQANDANGVPLPVPGFKVDISLTPIYLTPNHPPYPSMPCTVTPVPPPPPGSPPPPASPSQWAASCPAVTVSGLYLVSAKVFPDPTPPNLSPLGAATAAILVGAPGSPYSGRLILSDRLPAAGTSLSASYVVWGPPASTPQVTVTVLDSSSGHSLPASLPPFSVAIPSVGYGKDTLPLDTGLMNTGDRLADRTAVLLTGSASSLEPLAGVAFTVTPRPTPAPTPAASPPAGSCLSLPNLTALVGVTQVQEFELDLSDLNATYATLLSLATSPPPATSPTQYTFGKLTRWSFSLGVGGMFGSAFGIPAQVTGSSPQVIGRNPPSPAMAFVTADFHPLPYDETTFSPTRGERIRIMIGAAIAPNAGIVSGLGLELIRGLSLEAGGALLLGNVVPAGTKLPTGNPPGVNISTNFFGRLFLGLGYSLQ